MQDLTIDPSKLLNILIDKFNVEELRTVIFRMGENHESVASGNVDIDSYARKLISFYKRRGRVEELIKTCKNIHPEIKWDDLYHITPKINQIPPLWLDDFVNRKWAMAKLRTRILEKGKRLTLVIGKTGIGKTELLKNFVIEVENDFERIFFVEQDWTEEEIWGEILRSYNVNSEEPEKRAMETLCLRGDVLFVLDEPKLDFVKKLFEGASRKLRILVATSEPYDGEWVHFPGESIRLPYLDNEDTIILLGLVIGKEFTPKSEEWNLAEEYSRPLEGWPGQIVFRLASRIKRFGFHKRGIEQYLPGIQKGLEKDDSIMFPIPLGETDAFEKSVKEKANEIMLTIAANKGRSISVEAFRNIHSVWSDDDINMALKTLENYYLVMSDKQGERYSTHRMVCNFIRRKERNNPRYSSSEKKLKDYYVSLVEQYGDFKYGSLSKIRAEWSNIVGIFYELELDPKYKIFNTLIGDGQYGFISRLGYYDRANNMGKYLLEESRLDGTQKAIIHRKLGKLSEKNNPTLAREHYEESARLFVDKDQEEYVRLLKEWSQLELSQDHLEEVSKLLESANQIKAETVISSELEADLEDTWSRFFKVRKDYDEAIKRSEKALDLREELVKFDEKFADSLNNLAVIYATIAWDLEADPDKSDLAKARLLLQAEENYEKALRIYEDRGDFEGVTDVSINLGDIKYQRNDFREAIKLYEAGVPKAGEQVNFRAQIAAHHNIAEALTQSSANTYKEKILHYWLEGKRLNDTFSFMYGELFVRLKAKLIREHGYKSEEFEAI